MIRVTLKDGTALDVGEGFSYTVGETADGEPVILSAETIHSIVAPFGFGVGDAQTPTGENGSPPMAIKVLILEDKDSGIRIQVPLSIPGALQLAADLSGYQEEAGLALPEEGIVKASLGDLIHLPPPEKLG